MSTCGSPLPLFQRIALSRGCILAARQGGGQPSTPRQDAISAPDSRHTGHGERLAVARGGARRQNGPKARTIKKERRVGVRTGWRLELNWISNSFLLGQLNEKFTVLLTPSNF
ncbi:unnamed protein product [Arctogadus glacialis]